MDRADDFNPCLLIPVYNHGVQLPRTIDELRHCGLPCLLVNDGSDAETVVVIEKICRNNAWVQAKHLAVNAGKGVAVLTGIEWAEKLGYSHALQIDADGQHDVSDIPHFLKLARSNPSALVSGWPRYDDSIPASRLYGRYITHFWVWFETLSFSIKDSMCGFRVYPVKETRRTASCNRIGTRMDFDTDIMVRLYWDDVPVLFFPTRVIYPVDGVSHFAIWRDNSRISWMHTRLVLGMFWRIPKLLTRRWRVPGPATDAWYEKPERGAYWGMKLSLWCYRILGRHAMNALLRVVVFYFFLFNHSARRASRDFLQQVYRDSQQSSLSHSPAWFDSYRHFYHFSDALVDRVAAWNGDLTVSAIDFPDREKLRNKPQGIVVLTSHLGNVDMCRALANHAQGKKINVLLHAAGAPGMNRLLREVNPGSQLELLSVGRVSPATAILLRDKIEAGEWVVIAADRISPHNPGRTLPVRFLGRDAMLPQGAFVLAALLQAPVYAMFCLKESAAGSNRPHHVIHVEELVEAMPFSRRERQTVLQDVANRYVLLLEKYCRQSAFQWFNFYDFWHV